LLRLYKIFLSNHHVFAQLALGAFSSYDTAPAPVSKGLPLLLASPNKILHDKILKETTNIAPEIMDMDICTLWWVLKWIEERKADLGKADINKLNSYKNWVWKNKVKDRAGMKHVKPTPFSQGNTPGKNIGGAAAGSD
jgi:hypothetical protein